METSIKITLVIVSAVIILTLIGFYVFQQMLPTNTISSTGQSQIKAIPDLVSVYFSIQTNGSTSKEAGDKNAEISDALITALIKLGFERKEITTENYNIYPDYIWENGRQRERGFQATHSIKVEFSTSETSKIGDTIDAGIEAGALISYINFELSLEKQNEYKAIALKQATEDARVKATAIASGLGKKLGGIYSVSSSDFNYYPWRMYDAVSAGNVAEAKAATTSIQPGEQDVNAQVTVSYKIK
jgi:uncharacterized protein YggE